MNRRDLIKKVSLGAGALTLGNLVSGFSSLKDFELQELQLKGNVNHSACYWCYNTIPLDDFAKACAEMGLKGIDLLDPDQWKIAQKYGLTCSLGTDHFVDIGNGFNNPENHGHLQKNYKELIEKAADSGLEQVIVFSGNRNGMDDTIGIENCAKGLDPLVKLAEKMGITIVMELLNSKVNHKDYQCDHTPWGVNLVDKIDSSHFKLLYDIYHMQIMEGDVIATIKEYHSYFAHYHTGGVPGRHEINNSQELNYSAIIKAIVDIGFTGFVAQEFIPTYPDKLSALREGILICDV